MNNSIELNEYQLTTWFVEQSVRYVNLIISPIGMLLNFAHFYVLLHKELRSIAIFIILQFISVCDIITLLVCTTDSILLTIDYFYNEYCLGYRSYWNNVWLLAAMCISGSAGTVSFWLTVLMSFFRSMSIKFAMKAWTDNFNKTPFVVCSSLLTSLIPTVYMITTLGVKYEVALKNGTANCYHIPGVEPLEQEQYALFNKGVSQNPAITFLVDMFDNLLMGLPLLLYIVFTVMLAKDLRKQTKVQTALNIAQKKRNDTTRLIVTMLVCHFVTEILPIVIGIISLLVDVRTMKILTPIAAFTGTLRYLNSSTTCFMCILMSSQYRDTAQQIIRRIKTPVTAVERNTLASAVERYK